MEEDKEIVFQEINQRQKIRSYKDIMSDETGQEALKLGANFNFII